MIEWFPADCESVAPPVRMRALLATALKASPASAALYVKLGNVELDAYRYLDAVGAFECALRIDPSFPYIRLRLARCYNALARFDDVLDVLGDAPPNAERGIALLELNRIDAAEAELRAALEYRREDRRASASLCTLLRDAGRFHDLKVLCEALYAQGVRHAQLFYEWGRALALTGETALAKRLLFDPDKVSERQLPVPSGFESIASFNDALAGEIVSNPDVLCSFPLHEEANRGSSRVQNLLSGARPEIVRALLSTLQDVVSAYHVEAAEGFDPWPGARPTRAKLRPWGLIQRGEAYEEWHTHRGGWLSGVYYVRVPPGVTSTGAGPGCLEFGPPSALSDAMPDLVPRKRFSPREGLIILAPSHYAHRTIPSGIDADRVSFAFDVVSL